MLMVASLSSHAPLPRSWGRIASVGAEEFVPSPTTAELMWDRTQRLSLAFDSQGVANMLVSGQCGSGSLCQQWKFAGSGSLCQQC